MSISTHHFIRFPDIDGGWPGTAAHVREIIKELLPIKKTVEYRWGQIGVRLSSSWICCFEMNDRRYFIQENIYDLNDVSS